VRNVVKVLVVSAEPEPCGCIACARSCFQVLECGSGVLSNAVWIGATCGKGGSEVDGLCDVWRGGTLWGRLRGRDLEDEGDGDLGETKELWVRDGDGTSRDVGCCDLLEAIYKEEDVATPGEFAAVRFAMEDTDRAVKKRSGEEMGVARTPFDLPFINYNSEIDTTNMYWQTYLVNTAPILASVSLSTRNSRSIPSVKNPNRRV
jgi:hypothetical protein